MVAVNIVIAHRASRDVVGWSTVEGAGWPGLAPRIYAGQRGTKCVEAGAGARNQSHITKSAPLLAMRLLRLTRCRELFC